LTNAAGEQLKTSLNYTGRGTANYPNGDIYEGEFMNGVKYSDHIVLGERRTRGLHLCELGQILRWL